MGKEKNVFQARVDSRGRVTIRADIRDREKVVPGGWATLALLEFGTQNENKDAPQL